MNSPLFFRYIYRTQERALVQKWWDLTEEEADALLQKWSESFLDVSVLTEESGVTIKDNDSGSILPTYKVFQQKQFFTTPEYVQVFDSEGQTILAVQRMKEQPQDLSVLAPPDAREFEDVREIWCGSALIIEDNGNSVKMQMDTLAKCVLFAASIMRNWEGSLPTGSEQQKELSSTATSAKKLAL